MNAKQKLQHIRMTEWAARFADQKASGLKVRDWCMQNNISQDSYYYWKRVLKENVLDSMVPDIVPLPVPVTQQPAAAVPAAAPMMNGTTCASCAISASITVNGITMELGSEVSQEFLCSFIKAARYA